MNPLFGLQKDKQSFLRIPIAQVSKNPGQPRKIFEPQALRHLEDSIRRFGVITPLTVRKLARGQFELIAGERRLRAAKMAGLDAVPCYIVDADEQDSSLMALVENLQRRDLDFFEEAQSLFRLTHLFGLTQEKAAQKIGKTQSAVANKMRLLNLSPETIALVREGGLTERHARALLSVREEPKQIKAARHIIAHKLNVEQTEQYLAQLCAGDKPKQTRKLIIRDVKIFLNTVDKAVSTMKRAGIQAQVTRTEESGDIVMTVRIARSIPAIVSREPQGEKAAV